MFIVVLVCAIVLFCLTWVINLSIYQHSFNFTISIELQFELKLSSMICMTRTTRCGSLNCPVNITLYPSQWCYHETWSQCRRISVTIFAIYQRPLTSVKLREECQCPNCTVLMILLIKRGTSFSTVHVLFVKSIECSAASRYLGMLYKLNGRKTLIL